MPILTLTTDIGQRDYLVGAIKGQFLNLLPTLTICDITHYLSQTNFPQAAYTCNNAFKYYPPGTFHLVIANLFDSAVKYLLVAKYHEQYIICPDNGLLTMITGNKPAEMIAIELNKQHTLLQMTQLVAEALVKIHDAASLSAGGSCHHQYC
jgi:S-adenosylmethionine hydrolase